MDIYIGFSHIVKKTLFVMYLCLSAYVKNLCLSVYESVYTCLCSHNYTLGNIKSQQTFYSKYFIHIFVYIEQSVIIMYLFKLSVVQVDLGEMHSEILQWLVIF